VIERIASGLCAVVVVVGCKDKPAAAPPPVREPVGVTQSKTQPNVPVDAAVLDAAVVAVPVDAGAPLPPASKAERTMVETWFAKLNGTGKLAVKGVDHEPFRTTHVGMTIDATTQVARAPAPTDRGQTKSDKRTFFVTEIAASDGTRSAARVVMTFDAKGSLVGISY